MDIILIQKLIADINAFKEENARNQAKNQESIASLLEAIETTYVQNCQQVDEKIKKFQQSSEAAVNELYSRHVTAFDELYTRHIEKLNELLAK